MALHLHVQTDSDRWWATPYTKKRNKWIPTLIKCNSALIYISRKTERFPLNPNRRDGRNNSGCSIKLTFQVNRTPDSPRIKTHLPGPKKQKLLRDGQKMSVLWRMSVAVTMETMKPLDLQLALKIGAMKNTSSLSLHQDKSDSILSSFIWERKVQFDLQRKRWRG